jgi:hypothetical protein
MVIQVEFPSLNLSQNRFHVQKWFVLIHFNILLSCYCLCSIFYFIVCFLLTLNLTATFLDVMSIMFRRVVDHHTAVNFLDNCKRIVNECIRLASTDVVNTDTVHYCISRYFS